MFILVGYVGKTYYYLAHGSKEYLEERLKYYKEFVRNPLEIVKVADDISVLELSISEIDNIVKESKENEANN